jgi:hypothetical protein
LIGCGGVVSVALFLCGDMELLKRRCDGRGIGKFEVSREEERFVSIFCIILLNCFVRIYYFLGRTFFIDLFFIFGMYFLCAL